VVFTDLLGRHVFHLRGGVHGGHRTASPTKSALLDVAIDFTG
jgi:hypothetical protein